MKKLPTLVAGGLCAALLLAGNGHGQARREPFRAALAPRGFGGERMGPPGYGYGAGVPRGYGYQRPPPAFGAPPGYRAQPSPYRDGYMGYPSSGYRQNSLGADWREQQEEARAGVRQGQMAPLGRVIQGIGRRAAGRPLDAGIEYQGGRAVYRVRWMTERGRRVDYIVDAASGEILSEH